MKKYDVSISFRWIMGFSIEAENEDEAAERALEEAEIYLAENHLFADDTIIEEIYEED